MEFSAFLADQAVELRGTFGWDDPTGAGGCFRGPLGGAASQSGGGLQRAGSFPGDGEPVVRAASDREDRSFGNRFASVEALDLFGAERVVEDRDFIDAAIEGAVVIIGIAANADVVGEGPDGVSDEVGRAARAGAVDEISGGAIWLDNDGGE